MRLFRSMMDNFGAGRSLYWGGIIPFLPCRPLFPRTQEYGYNRKNLVRIRLITIASGVFFGMGLNSAVILDGPRLSGPTMSKTRTRVCASCSRLE